MQLMRALLVLAAVLAAVGQYVQELRRLSVIKRLPGPQARVYYETTRGRTERLLTVATVLLALAAVGVLTWSYLEAP